jgi:hypothetical protein
MALQTKEDTPQSVLDKIKLPGGARNEYTMIGRVDIDFTAKNYTALILNYASEAARQEDIQNGHPYFIGGPLTDADLEEMKRKDIRDVLYPNIERLIPAHANGTPGGRIG